jgi:hypothetical protein
MDIIKGGGVWLWDANFHVQDVNYFTFWDFTFGTLFKKKKFCCVNWAFGLPGPRNFCAFFSAQGLQRGWWGPTQLDLLPGHRIEHMHASSSMGIAQFGDGLNGRGQRTSAILKWLFNLANWNNSSKRVSRTLFLRIDEVPISSTTKVCGFYSVTFLNWTVPIVDWCVLGRGSKNKHHKDTCLKDTTMFVVFSELLWAHLTSIHWGRLQFSKA